MKPPVRPPVLPINGGALSRGFTLVELVITIAIMAIALLGVAYALQFSARYSADPLWQTKTVELVQAYTDEIFGKRYDELTPVGGTPACDPCSTALQSDAGETRQGGVNSFNDLDDYNGIDEQPPRDSLGQDRPEYAGYRVAVTVSYAGTELGLSSNQDAKEVTVTVTPPGQQPLPFSFYRGNF